MTNLPNPFDSATPQVAETAVVSPVHTPGTVDAAAEPLEVYGAGPLTALLTELDEHRFVLDEERFLADIEPLPLFLQAPIDVMSVLAAF